MQWLNRSRFLRKWLSLLNEPRKMPNFWDTHNLIDPAELMRFPEVNGHGVEQGFDVFDVSGK